MKKTFLALALTGFAASSFAYVDLVKGQTGALYTGGFVEANYLNHSEEANTASTLTVDKSSSRFRIRPRFELGFRYNDDTIRARIYLRNQFNIDQWQNKDKLSKKNTKNNPPVRVRFDRLYAEIGTAKLGTLSVGRQTTIGDYFTFNKDKAIINYHTATYGFAMGFGDRVIKYTTPYFNGAKVDYTFASKKGVKSYTRQNAVQVTYKLDDVTVRALASNDKNYNDSRLNINSHVYQVWAETKFEDLYVGASYTFAKKLRYHANEARQQSDKQQRHQFAVFGNYTVNQYLKPYLGFSVLTDKNNQYKTAKVTKQKTVQSYFGVLSTLYKQDNFVVSGFVEGAVSKTKTEAVSVSNNTVTKTSSKSKYRDVATGLKVSF